jgi:hypothetical protein
MSHSYARKALHFCTYNNIIDYYLLNFINMAPKPIDLSAHRAQIIEWACTNVAYDEIVERLRIFHGIEINKRTLKRRLQQWHVEVRTTMLDTFLLRAQITILFRLGNTDAETLEDLTDMGYQISIWAVTRIRKELGLIRRMNVFDRKAMDDQMFETLRSELDDGRIAGYGRRHLHVYFRRQGHMVTRYLLSSLNVFKITSH